MYGKVNVDGYGKRLFQLSDIEPVYETIQSNGNNEKYLNIPISEQRRTFTMFDKDFCFVLEHNSTTKVFNVKKYTIESLSLVSSLVSTEVITVTRPVTDFNVKHVVDCGTHFIFFVFDYTPAVLNAYKLMKDTLVISKINLTPTIKFPCSGAILDNEGNIIIVYDSASLSSSSYANITIARLQKDTLALMGTVNSGSLGLDYSKGIYRPLLNNGKIYIPFYYHWDNTEEAGDSGRIYQCDYNLSQIVQFHQDLIKGEVIIDNINNAFYYSTGTILTKRMLSNPSTLISSCVLYGSTLSIDNSHLGIVANSIILSPASQITNTKLLSDSQLGGYSISVYNTLENNIATVLNMYRRESTTSTGYSSLTDLSEAVYNFSLSNNTDYHCHSQCTYLNGTDAGITNKNRLEILIKPFPVAKNVAVSYTDYDIGIAVDDNVVVSRKLTTSVPGRNIRVFNKDTLEVIRDLPVTITTASVAHRNSFIIGNEVYYMETTSQICAFNITTGVRRDITFAPTAYVVSYFNAANGYIFIIARPVNDTKFYLYKISTTGTVIYSINLTTLYGISYSTTVGGTVDIPIENSVIYIIGPNSNLIMLRESDGSLIEVKTLSFRLSSQPIINVVKVNDVILYSHNSQGDDMGLHTYNLTKNINNKVSVKHLAANSGLLNNQINGLRTINGNPGVFAIHKADSNYCLSLCSLIEHPTISGQYEACLLEKKLIKGVYTTTFLPSTIKDVLYVNSPSLLSYYKPASIANYSVFKGYKIKK